MTIIQLPRAEKSFQQPLPEDQLLQALAKQLPEEEIVEVSEIASGLFNSTYLINTSVRQLILKVAPNQQADVFFNERYLMQREQSLSGRLSSLSNLIPRYLGFFNIGNRFAFLQEYIDGVLWHEVQDRLTTEQSDSLWQQLGEFARMIHQVPGSDFGYPTPHVNTITWYEFITANVNGMIKDCERHQIVYDEMREYQSLLPHYKPLLNTITESKLCHGDLWPRNVIINETNDRYDIAAVLDAERAFWGDPISDWVLLLYGVPDAFWQGYGVNLLEATDPKLVAIYRGMYYNLNILESTRFPESIEGYRKNLQRTNEILAY